MTYHIWKRSGVEVAMVCANCGKVWRPDRTERDMGPCTGKAATR